MSRGRGKKSGGIGGLILLLIVLSILNLDWVIPLVVVLGFAAVILLIIRAIVKEVKGTSTPKKDPVDVRTYGTYPKPETPKQAARPSAAYTPPAQPQPKPQPEKKAPAYSPEVQAIINEGIRAHVQLEHLYATIPDLAVKAKIRELIDVSDKIIEDAKDDPSDVPQIKKFLDYYLPTTIKLLNAYDRMGAQGIEGENISGTMQSIEEMLDTAVDAYKKLLDSLFANQALDVETDIQVMNTMLQREGLAGDGMPGLGKQ